LISWSDAEDTKLTKAEVKPLKKHLLQQGKGGEAVDLASAAKTPLALWLLGWCEILEEVNHFVETVAAGEASKPDASPLPS